MSITMRELRKNRGMSQRELGELCGVSRSLIALVEGGFIYAYPSIQDRIAKALGVLPSDIWPDEEVEGGEEE